MDGPMGESSSSSPVNISEVLRQAGMGVHEYPQRAQHWWGATGRTLASVNLLLGPQGWKLWLSGTCLEVADTVQATPPSPLFPHLQCDDYPPGKISAHCRAVRSCWQVSPPKSYEPDANCVSIQLLMAPRLCCRQGRKPMSFSLLQGVHSRVSGSARNRS